MASVGSPKSSSCSAGSAEAAPSSFMLRKLYFTAAPDKSPIPGAFRADSEMASISASTSLKSKVSSFPPVYTLVSLTFMTLRCEPTRWFQVLPSKSKDEARRATSLLSLRSISFTLGSRGVRTGPSGSAAACAGASTGALPSPSAVPFSSAAPPSAAASFFSSSSFCSIFVSPASSPASSPSAAAGGASGGAATGNKSSKGGIRATSASVGIRLMPASRRAKSSSPVPISRNCNPGIAGAMSSQPDSRTWILISTLCATTV
mmetsp:Transcript_10332/g.29510  ORF Transcript_10332/g.29510 Transcript_10332/m.29510 type:complete len:261 (+) Transcript_10332:349-1131(+)